MRIRIAFAALAAVALGCGSRAATSPPPPSPRPAEPPAASAEAPPAAPGDDRPLSDDDCAQLINHVVDIGLAAQRRTRRPDEVPTDDQVTQIRAEMIQSMTPECRRFDRASWRCAMAATDEAGLAACEQPAAK